MKVVESLSREECIFRDHCQYTFRKQHVIVSLNFHICTPHIASAKVTQLKCCRGCCCCGCGCAILLKQTVKEIVSENAVLCAHTFVCVLAAWTLTSICLIPLIPRPRHVNLVICSQNHGVTTIKFKHSLTQPLPQPPDTRRTGPFGSRVRSTGG